MKTFVVGKFGVVEVDFFTMLALRERIPTNFEMYLCGGASRASQALLLGRKQSGENGTVASGCG